MLSCSEETINSTYLQFHLKNTQTLKSLVSSFLILTNCSFNHGSFGCFLSPFKGIEDENHTHTHIPLSIPKGLSPFIVSLAQPPLELSCSLRLPIWLSFLSHLIFRGKRLKSDPKTLPASSCSFFLFQTFPLIIIL